MVAFTGFDGPDQRTGPAVPQSGSRLEYGRFSNGTAPAGYPPEHCGVPMEWSTPAARTMAAYSYDAGETLADLPDVWRCSCGFQLDSWVNMAPAAGVLADISRS
ncbi:hypothetical protein [Arthrobacter oryzae]|uniref:hypothetical protein n=1 Tax=Arthrobacter oryzae TaxID=409290 RepID=UPI00273AA487|nr:hypothetical protein [Arthrobacter oryzae]WLQ07941.1 hypothetical protein Q8Z05_07315 [Arthrobacter oryzae]